MTLRAPEYVRHIAPYQPGKPSSELARESGLAENQIIRLASNENPFGMSPSAQRALRHAVQSVSRYPDSSGFELIAALAHRHACEPAHIVLGGGSNDMLELALRTFVQPGDHVMYSQHAFALYMLAAQAVGAKHVVVPSRDFGHDLDAMLGLVNESTRLVFVANPNNPTGTFIARDLLLRFVKSLPADVIIVLDLAYHEYLSADQSYDAAAWLSDHPNLIICRTFSKIYGLAGLRIGYALAGAAAADLMNRVRRPFNTSVLAQAGALAALADDGFVRRSADHNARERQRLLTGLHDLGLDTIEPHANFVTVNVGDASKVARLLLTRGIIVRALSAGYDMPEWLRITVGTTDENNQCLAALKVCRAQVE